MPYMSDASPLSTALDCALVYPSASASMTTWPSGVRMVAAYSSSPTGMNLPETFLVVSVSMAKPAASNSLIWDLEARLLPSWTAWKYCMAGIRRSDI